MTFRLLTLALALSVSTMTPSGELQRFEYFRLQMGTKVRIVLYAPSERAARDAAARAFDRIAALDAALTDYNPESELMQACREAATRPVAVSPDLATVLGRALEYARLSGGAFDPTVGPVVALWRAARRQQHLPPAGELESALRLVGWRHVDLDPEQRTLRLHRAGMRLDLGGIAKGYAADRALEVLRQNGIDRALVAAGGDIALGDPPPGEHAWRIAIANPGLRAPPPDLRLSGRGVSTSGDAEQFVEIDGVRHSHIIDPRTGVAVRHSVLVTVIAPDTTESDALATAFSVLEPQEALRLADGLEGVSAYLVQRTSEGLTEYRSTRW